MLFLFYKLNLLQPFDEFMLLNVPDGTIRLWYHLGVHVVHDVPDDLGVIADVPIHTGHIPGGDQRWWSAALCGRGTSPEADAVFTDVHHAAGGYEEG